MLVSAVCSAAAETPVSTLLFGSLDAGSSVFTTVGVKHGFDRIDREGFALLGSAGLGVRTERASTGHGTQTRRTALGAALVGHQWFPDWGVVAAYAGPEGAIETLSAPGGTRVLPARFGLRVHGEIWARPTEATLLQATLIAGSTRASAWGRLAWGYRLWGAYLGPEIGLYVDGTGYRRGSLGLHATDFALGRFGLRASAGYAFETEVAGGGPYVALSVWTPW